MFHLFLDAPPQDAMSTWSTPVLLIAVFVVMYFFMIRPQNKKQKEQRLFQDEIVKGDKIVTISGIHGKIVDSDDKTVTIEMENGRMKIERVAVSAELTKATYPKK